ncbi:hypothetical protein AB3X91_16200 [Paraburkholderia sp. BR14263]|uniref:hypothetical protein n=1 Tax=unclassified Paraburkholderia TaxID=2615204 RepID=UPI0034CDE5FE
MSPNEAKQFMGVVARLIAEGVRNGLAPLARRLDELEARRPVDGIDGRDGKDGEPGRDGIDGRDGTNGTDGKDGRDGVDGEGGQPGRDGLNGRDGTNGADGKDGRDGVDGKVGDAGRDGLDGRDGTNGTDGKDGRDGVDGKDGEPGRDGRPGVDGKDGVDGEPGRDGRDGVDGERGTDGTPGGDGRDGRDGRDGKDGRDGAQGRDAADLVVLPSIDPQRSYAAGTWAAHDGGVWRADVQTSEFDGWRCVINGVAGESFEQRGERIFRRVVRMADGTVHEHDATIAVLIYRGVWQEDHEYEPGDMVTWGGSMWHCNARTRERPDAGNAAWTLAVKRGRDGKNGGHDV